jgi:hypothetical protein
LDTIIKNGLVIDGTGAPGRHADVGMPMLARVEGMPLVRPGRVLRSVTDTDTPTLKL